MNDIKGARCLGQAQLLIGRIQQDKLLLATRTQSIGRLPTSNGRFMQIHKIRRVTLLSLQADSELVSSPTFDVRLPLCPLHEQSSLWQEVEESQQHGSVSPTSVTQLDSNLPIDSQTQMSRTWHSIKSTSGRLINRASSSMSSNTSGQVGTAVETPFERTERRILDEIVKMFSESDNFYYSEDADLSECLQTAERKLKIKETNIENKETPQSNLIECESSDSLIQPISANQSQANERFFFNRHMLSFLNSNDPNARVWIVPIIQGFVQIERCRLPATNSLEPEVNFELALISRRSRHRAGTRYKRRGVDDQGHAANFVESEQLLCTSGHVLSFVQTRGSIPVHWAQPGVSYRPVPVLERTATENRESFHRHFEREFTEYGPITAINLVEQSGREKVLADAYLTHVLDLDDPKLTYVSFDFHEIW